MDQERIKAAVTELLLAVGENPEREGLLETPDRVAKMYAEIFSGLEEDPMEHLKIFQEPQQHGELVLVRDIPLYSVCEHHLLPFVGKVPIFPRTAGSSGSRNSPGSSGPLPRVPRCRSV